MRYPYENSLNTFLSVAVDEWWWDADVFDDHVEFVVYSVLKC